MADFLVIAGDVDPVLRRSLDHARALGWGEPSGVHRTAAAAAVAWPRRHAAGARIAVDGEAWLCASGTWFHREGLGTGDEAALLERFRRRDPRRAARGLDGFFAIVWSDGERIEAVTDLVASHQTYARTIGDATAIAGSALLLAGLAPTEPDPIGSRELLATGVVYEDRSPFADVRKLGPGAVFDLRAEGVRELYRYWSCAELEPESLERERAAEEFARAVRDVAARLTRAFARPVCDLTAGWDSRLLAGLLRAGGLRFDTTVTGPASSPDVVLSARVADRAGWRHHVIEPAPPPDFGAVENAFRLCDGEMDVLEYARIAHVHGQLATRFDISLNGSFGEVARGYWWEILEPTPGTHGPLDGRTIAERRYAAGASAAAVKALWPDDDFDPNAHFAAVVDRIDADLPGDPTRAFRLDHTYLRMRMRSWQGRIASTTDRLWPCLSPLLDRRALEVLLRCEWTARCGNRLARAVLAHEAPDLAKLPLEYGGPALPPRPWNAWRFAPAIAPLWRKVRRRVSRGSARPDDRAIEARLGLWQDERLRTLLDPRRMELAKHCDSDALAALIARTRQHEFGPEPLFGRLIGIEMALRSATGNAVSASQPTGSR